MIAFGPAVHKIQRRILPMIAALTTVLAVVAAQAQARSKSRKRRRG
jgi:hypothetical protein